MSAGELPCMFRDCPCEGETFRPQQVSTCGEGGVTPTLASARGMGWDSPHTDGLEPRARAPWQKKSPSYVHASLIAPSLEGSLVTVTFAENAKMHVPDVLFRDA